MLIKVQLLLTADCLIIVYAFDIVKYHGKFTNNLYKYNTKGSYCKINKELTFLHLLMKVSDETETLVPTPDIFWFFTRFCFICCSALVMKNSWGYTTLAEIEASPKVILSRSAPLWSTRLHQESVVVLFMLTLLIQSKP